MADDDEDACRRSEEFEALQAFYGDEVTIVGTDAKSGLWKIRITSSVDLEITLPSDYPSRSAPEPRICAPSYVIDPGTLREMEAELLDMYQEDTEVVILWSEHLRGSLEDTADIHLDAEEATAESDVSPCDSPATGTSSNQAKDRVFHPSTSKFGQPSRNFEESVISNEDNCREIYHGQPYHPPKSGPAETLIAHVASVESMEHVKWVLAELLFNDRKVAKASHNMIAYRFWDADRNCQVSDNDDDGEKGSGGKLAALLEMADARNVIVVVSRWFGGVHLGPARFKHFANTARDALEEAGFLQPKK